MAKHRLKLTNKSRDSIAGLLFFMPWLIGFSAITAYPLLYSVFISFNQVEIKPGKIDFRHIGFEYFRQAVAVDTEFPTKLMSSLTTIFLGTPLAVVFALVIALFLNKKFRFRAVYRMIFFMPVIIMSGPVMSELLTETAAMTINIDILNIMTLLQSLPQFFSNMLTIFLGSFVQILWFSGVQTIIFLAALQKVDRSMYEAASIDGASAWESFWKITLPHLRSIIILNTVYTIVEMGTFASDATNTKIIKDMRDIARPFSYAAAESWIYASFMLLFIVLAFLLLNDWNETRRLRDEKQFDKRKP